MSHVAEVSAPAAAPAERDPNAIGHDDAGEVDDAQADKPRPSVAPELLNNSEEKEKETKDAAGEDENSEAETLIQSPDKRKNIVDGAPRLEPSKLERGNGNGPPHKADTPSSDGRSRKRKRDDIDQNAVESHSSSRHSSPLSSPVPDANGDDSDSDISSSKSKSQMRGSADNMRAGSNGSRDGNLVRKGSGRGTEIKLRRRRPSDLLPRQSQHRSSRQRQSLDTSNQDRRETRSATYPRQSSNERSASPDPALRREHRRVASTQAGSSVALNKKSRTPAPLNTAISRCIQPGDADTSASSDESDSQAPSRPFLTKFASTEDVMSPAKGPGAPKKVRDKNGRTFLSRACNNNDLETARARYEERPMDLNVADNAGNTPLQIASLSGFTSIVEFLLQKGCEVDTKNIDKETPLIDAVENGHVQVVKLLLESGANPRLGNAEGEEPYELVDQEDRSSYQAIRKLIAEAKAKDPKRRKSEDQDGHKEGSSRAASAVDPRDSPPIMGPRSPPPGMRRKTGRSDYTRNDLLWQANTQENLTKLAGRGDAQGVCNILNILSKAETESLIAAAKGGHETTLEFLLGMGDPDPDPDPIRAENVKPGFNSPMLAAIGRGNVAVIRLLVNQSGFNPRRTFRGRTYPDISQERQGVNWQEEHRTLKTAYDDYQSPKARKHGSPRMTRDKDKEVRSRQRSSSPAQRRSIRSPGLVHKDLPGRSSVQGRESKRDTRREGSAPSRTMDEHRKVKNRDSTSGDHSVAVSSDIDGKSDFTKKSRRSQSDLHSLDTDTAQKRRRLITGKEHRRRASLAVAEVDSEGEEPSAAIKTEKREALALKRPREASELEKSKAGDSEMSRLTVKKRRTLHDSSSPEDTRTSPMKPVNVERGLRASRPGLTKRSSNDHEHASVLGEVDEIFKMDKRRKSVQPSVLATQESSELMEGIEVSEAPGGKPQAPPAEQMAVKREVGKESDEKIKAQAAARQVEEDNAAAERKKAEEAAARQKAEEDAIARKKEEEDRIQAKRDAEERQRRSADERKQREYLEAERQRQALLPSRLRKAAFLIDQDSPEVRSSAWLKEMLPLLVIKSSQIIPELEHLKRSWWEDENPDDEEWLPNFQVAYLLGTKDLKLHSYTSLEKRDVSERERAGLWNVSRNILSFDFHTTGANTKVALAAQKEQEERPKFMVMKELFWVKLSDFLDLMSSPRHAHLRGMLVKKTQISFYPAMHTAPNTPQSMETSKGMNGSSPTATHDSGMTNGANGFYPR